MLADQRVALHRPLAPEATLISRPYVKEIIDKGEGNAAILQFIRDLGQSTEDGTLVATAEGSDAGTQARRLRRQGHATSAAPGNPCRASRTRLRDSADAAEPGADLPIDGAIPTRCTSNPSAPRWRAFRGRSCMAWRVSASRPTRCWRADLGRLSAGAACQQSRRGSCGRSFPARRCAPRCGRTDLDIAFRCRTVERGEVKIDNGLASWREGLR